MREPLGGKPCGAMKVKPLRGRGATPIPANGAGPVSPKTRSEQECRWWDPKDGELYLGRAKPEEILVEARRDSDVQIDRQT